MVRNGGRRGDDIIKTGSRESDGSVPVCGWKGRIAREAKADKAGKVDWAGAGSQRWDAPPLQKAGATYSHPPCCSVFSKYQLLQTSQIVRAALSTWSRC
ncbi:hypothetical protein NL676_021596 [Syzygium grande]|nr:hypothetical protein NL676_021596 [Syzygium grande]